MSRRRVRFSQFTIDVPQSESEPWVNIIVQLIVENENNEIIQVVDRHGTINKRLSQVVEELIFLATPVPALNIMAVGNLAEAIQMHCATWMAEEFNGTVDPETGLVWIDE